MNQLFQNPFYIASKVPISQNYNQNLGNNYSSINDFEILNELGKGSFGLVYKVRRKNDNEIYALKKVHLNQLKPKEKENSLNEIRILASLNNKNIIQYKDAFYDSENSSLCLVMEFAENGDLEKKISDLKKNTTYLTEYEILNIFIQICKGLKTLHDRNIMHRDIKCANIFLFKNDIVKIGDLNVSKIMKNNLHNTQTGTPYYASPEVWDNKQYDFKSDIWSLGCLLYELTCLKAPFRGTSMKMVYDKVMKGSYEPIPKFYSKALSGIIYICLQTNPHYRPTCEQILNIIKEKITNFNLHGQKLNVLYEDDEIDSLKKINFNSNIDTNPSSERIIKYTNTENFKNKNINNVNNINNNNNNNKYNKALTEESKGMLLNTIKMPKRMNDINSVLPKNRYSSTTRKIPNGKFDLIKRRLPKIRADLNFKFNNLCTLNKNYSNSNILDHNLSKDNNNKSKIFTNKNLNSLNNNNNNKLLNRVYSEASMISEIYEINNNNNNNNNNKVSLIYNYNNNTNNNKERNKYNNMNYLNKSDDSKNCKENNENEIKEEILSNSNNTSMNNNNNINTNNNNDQNNNNNNNNKNSIINTNSSSNVDKFIEDIIKNNNDYFKNYHYIHNVNIQENNLTEGNNIINNNNNNLNNNNYNKILPRSQSQQKYENNFLQNERNININNLNINFNNLNNNNYNNNLSLNNNNKNNNHYNFYNPIKLVNRNILKNKENFNKSIGNEIIKTKNLLTEKLGVHSIKRKIIDGDILTEKIKNNNKNNTYDIHNNNNNNNNITVDNNKLDYEMQNNLKIFFRKLNKQPLSNNNNNNKIIKESKSYNNLIENKDNNISLSNLLKLNKNASHNNLINNNNNFDEIKEYKKIISNSTKNNTIENNKRSTSAKINFRPNFQKNMKKIPNNFHRKIDRTKLNKNFLYNQQYISDNRKLRTNKINKDLSSNFLLPTIDKSEFNNSNQKEIKNINILDEKIEFLNNNDFEFYNNNGFKKKINNIVPLSSKNDSVFSNFKKNSFNPVKLAPFNLNTLFNKYNKNVDDNNFIFNLNNNNFAFHKKIENKDNNIDYLQFSNNNKKLIKKFKLLENNLN